MSRRTHRTEGERPTVAGESEATASPEDVFCRDVPYDRRKALGQFFTPRPVARAMVRWACEHDPRCFLDPAVGPGVFIDELGRCGRRSIERIVAFDIDAAAETATRRRVAGRWCDGYAFRHADFLAADLDERFDAIVCNPPYIRHHQAKLPDAVFQRFERWFDIRLSRLSNVYCLFILRILTLLSRRGRAAIITPSEFLNADFGRAIKHILLGNPAFRGFVVFDPAAAVFDGIVTTACITLLDMGPSSDTITLSRARGIDSVEAALAPFCRGERRPGHGCDDSIRRVRRSSLNPADKWSTSSRHIAPSIKHRGRMRPLSDFGRCMRGIATGANAFFTLTQTEARQWALPPAVLKPCITKAAHARRPSLSAADHAALVTADKKALLLDIRDPDGPQVRAYLDHGEALEIHRRYLPRKRRMWHLMERRTPADLLVTVFGRKRLRFVRNEAGVLNLTAFHCVYMREECRRFIPFLMCYFHSGAAAQACAVEHRVYGDGLLKFEPKDVERLLIPDLSRLRPGELEVAEATAPLLAESPSTVLDPTLQARIDDLFGPYADVLAGGAGE